MKLDILTLTVENAENFNKESKSIRQYPENVIRNFNLIDFGYD